MLSNGRFLVASWAIGFQSIARYGLLFWVPVHFLGSDWKQEGGSWISVALPVGMAFGALTSGWLSDRVFRSRRAPVIVLFMGLAAAFSVAMYFIPKEQGTLGLIVLFLCGFFVFGPQSAFWALCPDLLGLNRSGAGSGEAQRGEPVVVVDGQVRPMRQRDAGGIGKAPINVIYRCFSYVI